MPVSLFRIIRNLVAFFAGMTLACVGLAHFAAFPNVGNIWRKHLHLEEHGNDYSLMYFGSSRVFHEFLPRQFDEALAKRGHPMTSFNYGQDGMWPPESLYMVRQILAMHPKKLKWVLIDLMPVKPFLDGAETTIRGEYWHDWFHTWLALRFTVTSPDTYRPWGDRLDQCYTHLYLWAERAFNAGVGSQKFLLATKLERDKKPDPISDEGWEAGPDRHLTLEELKTFQEETARLPKIPPHPIPALLRESLDKIVAEVRAAGAEPVFVVAAGFFGTNRFTDWPAPESKVKVILFDDPVRYPELYNPDHRFDLYHLNTDGAKDFTRFLSERFSEYLEEKR